MKSSRREFLKQAVVGSAAMGLPAFGQQGQSQSNRRPRPRRRSPAGEGSICWICSPCEAGREFPEDDFKWIRDFGFDFVRFPTVYRLWIEDGDDYKIKESMLERSSTAGSTWPASTGCT